MIWYHQNKPLLKWGWLCINGFFDIHLNFNVQHTKHTHVLTRKHTCAFRNCSLPLDDNTRHSSTLVKVMAYCRKAPSHYLNQYCIAVNDRAGASTTRVLVMPKMINMNILKTLYSSTDFPVLVLVCWVLAPAPVNEKLTSPLVWKMIWYSHNGDTKKCQHWFR